VAGYALCLAAAPASAQAPSSAAPVAPAAGTQAPPASVRIGAIDMDKVFEGYKKAEFLREQIKQEMIKKNAELSNLSNQMREQVKVLEGLDPSGNDYKLKEADLTRMKVEFETQREQAQAAFARRDAEALATIYKDIQDMASRVAKNKGLNFVVKVSNELPSGTDPNSVLAAMSHSIVFYDPSLDITTMVVYNLNLQYEKQGGASLPAAAASVAPADRATVPASAPAQAAAPGARPTR
jgi:outer membrane protein